MHTLTVQVQDSVFQEFLNFVSKRKETITIAKDKNLELDAYFYERQQKLHQIRADVKNGKMKLLSQEESDKEIDLFFQELENNR